MTEKILIVGLIIVFVVFIGAYLYDESEKANRQLLCDDLKEQLADMNVVVECKADYGKSCLCNFYEYVDGFRSHIRQKRYWKDDL